MKYVNEMLKKFKGRTQLEVEFLGFYDYLSSVGTDPNEIYILLLEASEKTNLFLKMLSMGYTWTDIADNLFSNTKFSIVDNKIYEGRKYIGYVDKETHEFVDSNSKEPPEF